MLAHAGQIDEVVDRVQQMIGRHVLLKAEVVEKRLLLESCARPSSMASPMLLEK